MEVNNFEKPFNDEEESGFDIMEWASYFLHHWYLFVIGIIISLGLANLQNRKWLPSYQTAGTVMIDEGRGAGATSALMQGFGVDAGYRNVSNQIIMLGSNDLMSRVVDSLPFMKVEYMSKGNFKTRNLYRTSPVLIETQYIAPEAYSLLFNIKLRSNGTFTITVDDNDMYPNVNIEGRYGVPIQHNLFFITVNDANNFNGQAELFFKFRTHESLVSEFASRVNFKYLVEGSSVLQISLVGETPERDMDFINKLCEVSLAENLDRKNDAANRTMNFIDSQLGKVSESLTASENEMSQFRKDNQMIDVIGRTGELMSRAMAIDAKQTEFKMRDTYYNYLTKYLKTNLEDGKIIVPSSLGLTESGILGYVQQINDLYIQRSEVTEKNMYYAKFTKDINNVKASLLELLKSMRATMDIEKNEYNKRLADIHKEMETLPEKELQMIAIQRKYKVNDNYYTFFLQKRAESEILKASNTPDNKILDKARIITITNGGQQSKLTLKYLLFGLLIPTIFVILKELLNNTVRTNRDVEKNSPFPLIGAVRHTLSNDPLLIAKNPRSSFTEMFRAIRTRIEFIVQRKSNIMIMITSAESGDGKTYFSINLAGIYAMASPKTLLVDMDIRKPSINQQFNIAQTEGVTNYLINQCSLDDIIIKLPEVEFDILPAGTIPPNSGELIRSDKLVEMFIELRKRYDYIILDTSPIGIVTDAYSLAVLSDVNLFVVRNSKTNKSFFKKLTAQLKSDKLQNIYTVMNDVYHDGDQNSKFKMYKYVYMFGYNSYGYGYSSKMKKNKNSNYYQYYQDDTEI
jgi:tyrosine-protein kinase Etk/Wzc